MNTVNHVVAGSVLDQRSTALVKLFAKSLIEAVMSAANPITHSLGNIFNYGFSSSRSNYASMLVPALLVGAMSSDVIGHQASGVNRSASMLDKYKDLELQQSQLAKEARDLSSHLGDKRTEKKKAPSALSKELSADAIKSNRKALKKTRKQVSKLERKAQKSADEVKSLESISPRAKLKIKHLKHDLEMAQVRYDAQPDSANHESLQSAQRRFKLGSEIIKRHKSMSNSELKVLDHDLQKIIEAEKSAEQHRKQAQSRWFSRGANAERNKADEYDLVVHTTLNKYGVN